MRSILMKTPLHDFVSLAVSSDQNPYGISEDLVFSFPCRSKGEGDFEIVKGLSLDPFLQKKIALTEKELLEERDLVRHLL